MSQSWQKVKRDTNPHFFISDCIQVRKLKGKGRGIIATDDIPEDSVIELSPAISIPDGQSSLLSATILANYTFAASESGAMSCLGLGYTSLYNHDSNPNAEFLVNEDAIAIVSLRDIKAGEEITVSYGWHDDEDEYEFD